MQPLIGLIGKKRSGKDTFAATLTAERGFARLAFADPLKEALASVNPLVFYHGLTIRLQDAIQRIGWERAKDECPEVRRLLQEYGVAIRGVQPDFWVVATMHPVAEQRTAAPVVITDVRFPNEAEAITGAGGRLVRIIRPGSESADTHVSETALDGFPADVLVFNNGTLEDLATRARTLYV